MTDKEFERIISFIVNENVVRRLLDSAQQSDNPNNRYAAHARDCIQSIKIKDFFN
jgi:hypothetical protein